MAMKDTEALVGNVEMPEVDAEVISREESELVAVHRHRVDVVRVSVSVHTSGTGLHHKLRWYNTGHRQ
jgi:hypothetical protein